MTVAGVAGTDLAYDAELGRWTVNTPAHRWVENLPIHTAGTVGIVGIVGIVVNSERFGVTQIPLTFESGFTYTGGNASGLLIGILVTLGAGTLIVVLILRRRRAKGEASP